MQQPQLQYAFYYLLLSTYKEYSTTLLLKYLILLLTPSRMQHCTIGCILSTQSLPDPLTSACDSDSTHSKVIFVPDSDPSCHLSFFMRKGCQHSIQEAIVEMWSHLLLIKETVPGSCPKANAIAYATAKRPQSLPPDCMCKNEKSIKIKNIKFFSKFKNNSF